VKRNTPISQTDISLEAHGWPKQHLVELQGPDGMWYHRWLPDVNDLEGHFPAKVLKHCFPTIYGDLPDDEEKPDDLFPSMTAEQLEAQVRQEDLIEETIVMRKVSMLWGDSNTGKTYVAISMALSIATGRDWMHKRVTQGGVIYILAEGSDDAGGRQKAWRDQYGVPLSELSGFLVIGKQTHLVRDRTKLMRSIERDVNSLSSKGIDTVLVVIDTLRMCTSGIDENSSLMGEAIDTAILIRETFGPHVMIVHHENKNGKYSGHSSLRSNVDEAIQIKENKDSSDVIEFMDEKRRGRAKKREPLMLLRKVVGTGEVDKFNNPITECVMVPCEMPQGGQSEEKPRRETQRDRMLSILGRSGMTNTEWKSECEKALGMNPNTFQTHFGKIKQAGALYIYKEGDKYFRQIDTERELCPKCNESHWVYDGPMNSLLKMRCTKCNPHFDDEHIFTGDNTTVSGKGK